MAFHILRRRILNLSISSSCSISISISSNPKLESQFTCFSTRISKSSKDITQYLVSSHQLSHEAASNAASVLRDLKNYKTSSLTLDYLKQVGLSNSQLEELIKSDPCFLALDLSKTIKPRIEAFLGLGFSPVDLADLLSSVPAVLAVQKALPRLVSSLAVLQWLLGPNHEVVRLLKVSDWFLSSDLDRHFMPNIKLMESCGVKPSQTRQVLFNFPRFFLHKNEFLRDCVRRTDEMGLSRESKMFIHGVRTVSSMSLEKWESKVELFRSLGLSEHDILTVFRRTPQVFAISEEKIKEVSNLLISLGGVDISFVVQYPELLIYSATRRIKPRLQIFHILQSKNLMQKVPRLTSFCKFNDSHFIRKFVLPFVSQLGEAGEKYLASRDRIVCNASV